jgi:hypothetical protein
MIAADPVDAVGVDLGGGPAIVSPAITGLRVFLASGSSFTGRAKAKCSSFKAVDSSNHSG